MSEPPAFRHIPALDGLRGIAVMLVFVFHTPGMVGYLPGGSVGVDLFFALSGFLITALLVQERERAGRIDLRNFYARRALRLLPALGLALAGVFLLSFTEGSAIRSDMWGELLAVATYSSNWFYAFDVIPRLYLQHSWSLAVEEQYYLLWPIVVLALTASGRSWRTVATVALSIAVLSVLWRLVLLNGLDASYNRVYFATDTRLDGLLLGSAAGAMIVGDRSGRLFRLAAHPAAPPVGIVALLGVLGWARFEPGGLSVVFGVGLPAVALAAVVIAVLGLAERLGPLRPILEAPVLTWVGRRSYAVYLFHIPVLIVLRRTVDPPATLRFVVAVAVTLALAELSWRFVESRALRHKERFRSAA